MKHKIISFLTVIIMAVSAFVFWGTTTLWIILALVVILFLAITSLGSFLIQWNYFLRSVNHIGSDGIVLSFDDGPDPVTTPQLLNILSEHHIKACFFVIGKKAEQHPEIVKLIEQQGHIIGNHSYEHHKAMGFFSAKKLEADIKKCSKVIKDITGKTPLFFRPPFGVTNPRYSRVLKQCGLTSVGWSGRSFDTVSKSKVHLFERVKKHIKPGTILLFHDDREITVDTLPEIIKYCHQKGIKIVSLPKA